MSSQPADQCPVDHSTRAAWAANAGAASSSSSSSPHAEALPTARSVSSIPRTQGENWVYPSESQFYKAMERKNHNPNASDMRVIVPIHNAVNERAWGEVLGWESGRGGEQCGGLKLMSFKGSPKKISPRARWNMLWGYQAPFDRHDWVVDRCGKQVRYVIDFYTGRPASTSSQNAGLAQSQSNVSFYLDVRPALDSWEGVKMRAERFWDRWTGRVTQFGSLTSSKA